MKSSPGFSTCLNDAIIFDALVPRKLDTGDLEFDVVLAGIKELNRNAYTGYIEEATFVREVDTGAIILENRFA